MTLKTINQTDWRYSHKNEANSIPPTLIPTATHSTSTAHQSTSPYALSSSHSHAHKESTLLNSFHHISFYHGNKLLFRRPINNNMARPTIKLKLGGTSTSLPNPSLPPTPSNSSTPISIPPPTPSAGAGTKIRFSLGGRTPTIKSEAPSDDAPLPTTVPAIKTKAGRAPKLSAKLLANKKRVKEEDSDDDLDASPNGHITIDTSRAKAPSKKKLKFSISSSHAVSAPKTPVVVKAKFKGKPPKRPLGEGYDSEASDVEEDPVIEEEWILRMLPGDDCEYLRTMILERKIGVPKVQGGADIYFKFFHGEGRRAAITIRGNCYAATMVDLPCIIEGMKSWDKKGWYKSADICQMLLVFAPIAEEKEAETIALPRTIDPTTWQYPHGITAPMRNARKNRFRKRIRREAIEAVEDAVEKLLAADAEAHDTRYEMMDPDVMSRRGSYSSHGEYGEDDEDGYSNDEEADAEGEVDDDVGYFNHANGQASHPPSDALFDDMDLEAEFEREMLNSASELATPSTSTPLPQALPTTGSPAFPTSDQEGSSSSDESDDDGSSVTSSTHAANAELAGLKEDIAEMERQLESLQKSWAQQSNPILKARVKNNIDKVKGELELKRSAIGVGDGEEEEV